MHRVRLIIGTWLCGLVLLAACTDAQAASAEQVTGAVNAARAYWHTGAPHCGTPTIVAAAEPLPEDAMGAAWTETCTIAYEDIAWRAYPVEFCQVIVHEWGHLMLGDAYFLSVNATDPAHSPDPHNVMHARGGDAPRVCRRLAPRWRRATLRK